MCHSQTATSMSQRQSSTNYPVQRKSPWLTQVEGGQRPQRLGAAVQRFLDAGREAGQGARQRLSGGCGTEGSMN